MTTGRELRPEHDQMMKSLRDLGTCTTDGLRIVEIDKLTAARVKTVAFTRALHAAEQTLSANETKKSLNGGVLFLGVLGFQLGKYLESAATEIGSKLFEVGIWRAGIELTDKDPLWISRAEFFQKCLSRLLDEAFHLRGRARPHVVHGKIPAQVTSELGISEGLWIGRFDEMILAAQVGASGGTQTVENLADDRLKGL